MKLFYVLYQDDGIDIFPFRAVSMPSKAQLDAFINTRVGKIDAAETGDCDVFGPFDIEELPVIG